MKPNSCLFLVCLWIITGCSVSDSGPKCDACEIQGQRVSFCENEDGTYHLASAGESIKYSAEELEEAEVTFEELKKTMCDTGQISF